MRRRIDSDYQRKKRYSRRPRDNWRKVKSKGRKMDNEYNILYMGAALFLLWICSLGILFNMVY